MTVILILVFDIGEGTSNFMIKLYQCRSNSHFSHFGHHTGFIQISSHFMKNIILTVHDLLRQIVKSGLGLAMLNCCCWGVRAYYMVTVFKPQGITRPD